MAALWCSDLQSRPTEMLDLTSLTLNEFQQLIPPFAATFQTPRTEWRLEGTPHTARRFTVDKNWPFPTLEDRLLFLLVSLQTSPLPVVHGRLFRMLQGQAKQWLHVPLPSLLAARRALGMPRPTPL